MTAFFKAAALTLALGAGASTAQAGCLTGAAVGGVGGHFAGHHPVLGAVAGCAVGHHLSVMKKRRAAAGQATAYRQTSTTTTSTTR